MILKIHLFAAAKEVVGSEVVEVELEAPATVAAIKEQLIVKFPDLEPIVARSAIAVNQDYALDGTTVEANSEVGLIPPVSGG